jgi:hypothetical protein
MHSARHSATHSDDDPLEKSNPNPPQPPERSLDQDLLNPFQTGTSRFGSLWHCNMGDQRRVNGCADVYCACICATNPCMWACPCFWAHLLVLALLQVEEKRWGPVMHLFLRVVREHVGVSLFLGASPCACTAPG